MSARRAKELAKAANKAQTLLIAKLQDIGRITSECSASYCMVEVTKNSLEGQEIGTPEQATLARALQVLWPVCEFLSNLEVDLRFDEN